jgi:EAL domain-containing protein (putative c-di-GMP-specific phosphodiesterase class I)
VKIDRSFIHDLPGNRDSGAITRAIVQMGHSLDITVIAEGVETEAQLELLAKEGCQYFQGFLCAEPLDVAALVKLVGGR